MRHACRAAAQATTAALIAAALAGPSATAAQALDSPGGTSAVAATASSGAPVDATQAGAAMAPSTHGTGGTEYGVLVPTSHAARKPASHKPSRAVRRPAVKPRPKPKAKPRTPPRPTVPTPPVASTPPPGSPTLAQTVGEGAVFPVIGLHSFGGAENRFGAGRPGHIHQGQDVLASEGQEVVAPLGGTIITAAYQAGGAGWYVAEHGDDGLDFFYAHCQAGSPAVVTGQTVSAGQAICRVGHTGDATGPHLHFEIWVGGWQAAGAVPIDPLPYLEAWDRAVGS